MKVAFLFQIILISLFCTTKSFSCPSEIAITPLLTQKTCRFFFTAINQTCDFQKCLFRESSSQSAYAQGWIQCFESCCGTVMSDIDISLSPLSKASQCEDIFISKTRNLLGVSIGVSLGVVLLFIIAIACIKYKCFLYKWCLGETASKQEVKAKAIRQEQQFIKSARTEQAHNPTNIFEEGRSENTSEKEFIKGENSGLKLMTYDIKSNPQLVHEKCRVCKLPKVSCYLSCNHYFHIECIGKWLLEQLSCASCGSDKVKYIHLFCIDCRVKLKVQQIHKFRSSFRRKLTFRCGDCQERR